MQCEAISALNLGHSRNVGVSSIITCCTT